MAILKSNKPADNPKSYRLISLLCVPNEILKRLILARINPVIEPQLPSEQAGFRQGRSKVQQVLKLTYEIEKWFDNEYKAGAVMVGLTAAYDTVWQQSLALKHLRIIPDCHLARFIMNISSNRSFKLKTSEEKKSTTHTQEWFTARHNTVAYPVHHLHQQLSPTSMATQMTWHFFTPTNADQKLKKRYLEIWRMLLTSNKPKH